MLPYSTICEGTWSTKWNLKNAKLLLLTPLNAYFMLNKNWTMFRLNSFCNWKKQFYDWIIQLKEPCIIHNPKPSTRTHLHSAFIVQLPCSSALKREKIIKRTLDVPGDAGGGWCCCDRRLPKQPGLGRRGGPLHLSCLLRKCHLKWPSIRQEARLYMGKKKSTHKELWTQKNVFFLKKQ